MNLRQQSEAPTLECSSKWISLPVDKRFALIQALLEASAMHSQLLALTGVTEDGQVTLRFLAPVGPERRSTILLDFEDALKREIDEGLTVWLEPLGDRNSLRNLRGIEVKKG